MHWTSHPCCIARPKIHLTHNKGITFHKIVADMRIFKHASLHSHLRMYSQLIHKDTSVQKPLPPLGTVTFLRFSRSLQSSALSCHAAIKEVKCFSMKLLGEKLQRLLMTSVSSWGLCALSFTGVSTPSPRLHHHRYRFSAVITAKWLRVTLLRDEGPMLAFGHLGTHPATAWLRLDPVSQHMLEHHGYCSDLHQQAGIGRTRET